MIEGYDGSGKTTVGKNIDKIIRAKYVHLFSEYDVNYSNEFISNIWCQKIPKLLATEAKKDWVIWYYTMQEKGKWKRCSRCHKIKLAHPYFFTRNNTAKDGWYSMCKECRNKKKG